MPRCYSVAVSETEQSGIPHLPERLNALFSRIPQRPGSPQLHTNQSAAKAISQSGVRVTSTHISLLRSGKRNNPSARLLAAIADLFDVPITFFFDAGLAERIIGELDLLAGLRDTQVRAILARATGADDHDNLDLAALIRQIRDPESPADEENND